MHTKIPRCPQGSCQEATPQIPPAWQSPEWVQICPLEASRTGRCGTGCPEARARGSSSLWGEGRGCLAPHEHRDAAQHREAAAAIEMEGTSPQPPCSELPPAPVALTRGGQQHRNGRSVGGFPPFAHRAAAGHERRLHLRGAKRETQSGPSASCRFPRPAQTPSRASPGGVRGHPPAPARARPSRRPARGHPLPAAGRRRSRMERARPGTPWPRYRAQGTARGRPGRPSTP